jgi:hypothetical protein
MSAADLLKSVLAGFAASLRPLRDAIASPDAFAAFLTEFGWTLAPADLTNVTATLGGLASLPDDTSSQSLEEVTRELTAASDVIRRVTSTGAPAAFASTFPRELLDYLAYSAMAQGPPGLFGILHLVGVLQERQVAADAATGRAEYTERRVHWDRLTSLAGQPLATFRESYGWGRDFDGDALLRSVGILVRAFGGNAGMYSADRQLVDQYYARGVPQAAGARTLILSAPFLDASASSPIASATVKLAFLAIPIPPSPTAPAPPDGLALMPVITGTAAETVALSDRVSLKLGGDFRTRPVRAELHPGSAVVRASAGDSQVEAAARLDATAPAGAPWIAAGDADSSRLEVAAVHASLGMRGQLDGELDLQVEVGLDAATLVVELDEGDGFVQSFSSQPARSPISLLVKWSSRSGFSLGGQPKLAVTVPVHRSLGDAATLTSVSLALGAGSGSSVTLDATVTFDASIGPVAATIADTGVRARLMPVDDTAPPGNLGNIDLQFGFKPPSGVGLVVDAAGVSGGGFLFHDPAQGAYAGVMQLSLHDELTLTAYGIIATRMPDGGRGYSLLIFITAEGFKPVPLGFGFQLEAIGGMVGVHRTFDQEVLKAGLKNDTLATLLFPRDPVANAPALIQALAAAFPARQGSYLLGLIARITWFTPTLVRLDLALVLELGARTRLLALGRVSALLPSLDNDQIRLNLDAIGVLDFDAGTLACDAVLVDSRLAHQFPITGSAALRAAWPGGGGSPAGAGFVLAVGGLNPRFAAPAAFPPLERVTIALCSGDNPRLVCDAYLAVTANTIQFGARTSLYAEALGFSVAGDLGFDALVELLPPHFIVDFHASVQLKRGSHNLFKVTLDGTLEGPLPLRLAAKATFELLWMSFSVHFDFTLSPGDLAEAALPAVALAAELARALADPGSWSTRRPAGLGHGVALRGLPPGPGLVLDPLGQLVVRQQVAPLNAGRDVDTYGGSPVAGARRFHLAAALQGEAAAAAPGAFAPARYFTMSDDEKLAAPSFEAMDAGLVLGDGGASFDPATVVAAPLTYASIVLGPAGAPDPAPAEPGRYDLPAAALGAQRGTGAAARAPARQAGAARFRNAAAAPAATLAAPRWRIVHASDGAVAPEDPTLTTWSEHRAALAALNRGGARWLMVPAHELQPSA